MSKKMKLNLGELKVTSFLTSLEREQGHKIRGGVPDSEAEGCTDYSNCTCQTCFTDVTCDFPCTVKYPCVG